MLDGRHDAVELVAGPDEEAPKAAYGDAVDGVVESLKDFRVLLLDLRGPHRTPVHRRDLAVPLLDLHSVARYRRADAELDHR